MTTLGPTNMNKIETELALLDGGAADHGAELAYAQWTVGVVINASAEASAVVLATCPAVVFDGSPVMVEAFVPYCNIAGGGTPATVGLWLYLDGASIGGFGSGSNPGSVTSYTTLMSRRRVTPSAASHVFSLRATANPTGATASAGVGGAAADPPGFIRITRV